MTGYLTPDINTTPWFTKNKSWIKWNVVSTYSKSALNPNINQHILITAISQQWTKHVPQKKNPRNLHNITMNNLYYMYTKTSIYRHVMSINAISLFFSPKLEGLVRHRVFSGQSGPYWGKFISLTFFLCPLVSPILQITLYILPYHVL